MNKTLVALLVSILGISSSYAAGLPGKNDILDPIYDTAPLPTNYYEQEKTKNKIIFANDHVPGMKFSVEFVKAEGRPLQEVLAEKIFTYKQNNKGDVIQNCLPDNTMKSFASVEYFCVKNQDSTVRIIVTQFKDSNNQPSDFYRIAVMSAKTGDAPPSDDLGELINHANYKLGFFETFNIPQQTNLSHNVEPYFQNIDHEGFEQIKGEGKNIWLPSAVTQPLEVENLEISDKGMKFFLKMKDTNEKFVATMFMSDSESPAAVLNQIKASFTQGYHNCEKLKEFVNGDIQGLTASCDEGDMKVNIRRLPIHKYEYKVYEVITGSVELLDNLFANQSLSKQLSEYLFKEFYNRELLLKTNNVFSYISDIDAGSAAAVPIQFIVDRSTVKSLNLAQSIPSKDSKAENGKNGEKEISNTSSLISSHETNYEKEDYTYTLIAAVAGIGALVIILVVLARNKKKRREEEEQERIRQEQEASEMAKSQASPLSSGDGELLAELEAERAAKRRAAYQQKRDAELLAEKLEAQRKNGGEDEAKRRKEALQDFHAQNAPAAIASALSTAKDTVAESNIKANEQIKAQREAENSVVPVAKPEGTPNKESPKAKAKGQAKAGSTSENVVKLKPVPQPEPKAAEQTVQKPESNVDDSYNPQSVPNAEGLKENTKSEAEIKAEEERKRKEAELKAKTNDLLMKMKMGQKSDLASRNSDEAEKETVKQTKPTKTDSLDVAKSKFSLHNDNATDQQVKTATQKATPFGSDEFVQPAPQVQQPTQSPFGSDDFVQPAPQVQQPAQSPFGSDDFVQPAPQVQQPAQSPFGSDDFVQPAPQVQQTAQTPFGSDDFVQPAPQVQQTAQSTFGSEEFVQPSVAEQKPKPKAKAKAKDPLEELSRRSKRIEPKQEDEMEIDLEDTVLEDINLDMYANDHSTTNQMNSADSSEESLLDITGNAENILDLTGMEEQIIPDANDSKVGYEGQAVQANEAPAEPEPKPKPARKSTKKIRKFNLGSLSTSISDRE